jgi:predicted transcriptional regulator
MSILPRSTEVRLGQLIRTGRCQLDLTQKEVAKGRAKISQAYVGIIESGKRRPADTIVARLAKVLDLGGRDLLSLLHPRTHAILNSTPDNLVSAWKQFKHDNLVRRLHQISEKRDGNAVMRSSRWVRFTRHASSCMC